MTGRWLGVVLILAPLVTDLDRSAPEQNRQTEAHGIHAPAVALAPKMTFEHLARDLVAIGMFATEMVQ